MFIQRIEESRRPLQERKRPPPQTALHTIHPPPPQNDILSLFAGEEPLAGNGYVSCGVDRTTPSRGVQDLMHTHSQLCTFPPHLAIRVGRSSVIVRGSRSVTDLLVSRMSFRKRR